MQRTSRAGFLAGALVMILMSATVPASAGEVSRAVPVDGTQEVTSAGKAAPARFIRLRNRTFDPVVGGAESVAPTLRAAAGSSAHLLQFAAVPLEVQRNELRRLGVRIGAYLPDFAYVVRMSPTVRQSVANPR